MSGFFAPEGAIQFEVTKLPWSCDQSLVGSLLWVQLEKVSIPPMGSTCSCQNFFRVIAYSMLTERKIRSNWYVYKCMGRFVE